MALKTHWKERRKKGKRRGRKEGGRKIQVFTINIFKLKTEKQLKQSHLKLYISEHVHTAIFKKESQQGPTVYYTELCSMLCGSLDRRRVWRRMDTCICTAEFLQCPTETITTLLISYTPIQNKKLKKKCPKKKTPRNKFNQSLKAN